MKKIFKYAVPMAVVAGLACTQRASANSMGLMAYSSGGGTLIGTATVPGTQYSLAGSTTDWSLVSATGTFTSPPAEENVTTVDTTSTGAGTLTIIYSVAGVTTATPTDLDISLSSVNLAAGMTVQDLVYVNTASGGTLIDDTLLNVADGLQLGPTLSAGSLSVLAGSGLAPGTPYTLTEELIVTASAAGETASFSAQTLAVPDGGTTMILLGGAFCAIGAIRRKLGSK